MKRIVDNRKEQKEHREYQKEQNEKNEKNEKNEVPRRQYESYHQMLLSDINEEPFDDPLDIHVHRYTNSICIICNKKNPKDQVISTTSLTNLFELDKKYLKEHLNILGVVIHNN